MINHDPFRLRAARHPLAHALHAALDALAVPHGAPVVLAISGGGDSMALLGAAAGLVHRGRLRPHVAHVDHGLRPDSAREGDLVAEACAGAGLPVARLAVSLAPGGNVSARARAARYDALASHALAIGAPCVATAHHADDQLETMVMGLGRGAGLARLGGMRGSRTLVRGVRLIRPLLGVRRCELRAACAALGLRWAEDPGNADPDRPRGVVRHRIVPILESTWPGCATRAARVALTVQWAADALLAEARALRAVAELPDGLARSKLRAAPLPVVAAVVRMTAGEACDGDTAWRIAQAIGDATTRPRTWRLADGVVARVTARTYSVVPVALRQR